MSYKKRNKNFRSIKNEYYYKSYKLLFIYCINFKDTTPLCIRNENEF